MKITKLLLVLIFLPILGWSQLNCSTNRYCEPVFSEIEIIEDVKYGEGAGFLGLPEELKMDFYIPKNDGLDERPFIMFAHGGHFMEGTKKDSDIVVLSRNLAHMGYVVASIDYRKKLDFFSLNGEAAKRAAYQACHDMRAAIRYMKKDVLENGNTYGIDTNYFFIGGTSAGAITAIHTHYLNTDAKAALHVDTTDLGDIYGNSGNPGYTQEIHGIINLSGAILDLNYIDQNRIPMINMHGNLDDVVPYGHDFSALITDLELYGSYEIQRLAENSPLESDTYTFYNYNHIPYYQNNDTTEHIMTVLDFVKNRLAERVGCSCNDPSPLPNTYTNNIAVDKPISASSSEANFGPSLANDGDYQTRWSSTFNDNQSIEIDLQNNYDIHQIVLNWETAFGEVYTIQLSDDNQNWTEIESVSNGDGGADIFNYTNTIGRYLKIECITRGTDYGFSLFEIEVYGDLVDEVDETPPVADSQNLEDILAECEVTSLTAPTARDDTDGSITGSHSTTLPITSSTVITWTYEDSNGNTSTQTQNIIIDDVTGPIADVVNLPTISAQCEVTELETPTATDNCEGTIMGEYNISLPINESTTITWIFQDGNGNTTTQTQEVVIQDETAPVADEANLQTISAQCEVTDLDIPTATDNCEGTILGEHNVSLPITGSTTITWIFQDGNGNTTTQTQEVVIQDETAPVADAANLQTISAQCEVTDLDVPTATDNCKGTILGEHNVSLPITESTMITWTFQDGNGNTTTQTQEVVIQDETAPVANLVNLPTISSECEVTELETPTATDNCEGTIMGEHNASLPITNNTTITWTYQDNEGNTTTQNQEIVITEIDNGVTKVDPITLSANEEGYSYQWIDCEKNNAPIAGATSQTFVATENGNYAVIISNEDCSSTSECTVINSLNTENYDSRDMFTLYPNPSKGTISVSSSSPIESIQVYAVSGELLYTTTLHNADSSLLTLPPARGIYLVKVNSKNSHKIFRVVKH